MYVTNCFVVQFVPTHQGRWKWGRKAATGSWNGLSPAQLQNSDWTIRSAITGHKIRWDTFILVFFFLSNCTPVLQSLHTTHNNPFIDSIHTFTHFFRDLPSCKTFLRGPRPWAFWALLWLHLRATRSRSGHWSFLLTTRESPLNGPTLRSGPRLKVLYNHSMHEYMQC